jgi:transcriptional regulator with XRE-family HTH domain
MLTTLRQRREALGLTQQEVAAQAGTSQSYYGQIELGQRLPNAELRRAISAALGIRHVDFLVAVGELGDWEVPGFDATNGPPDPETAALVHLVESLDLSRSDRAATLASILQFWAQQDRARPE